MAIVISNNITMTVDVFDMDAILEYVDLCLESDFSDEAEELREMTERIGDARNIANAHRQARPRS